MLLFYFQCDAISVENFSYRTVHSIGLPVLHFEIYILQAQRLRQSRIQLNIFNSKACGLKYAFKVCRKIDSSQWNIIMSHNRDTNTHKQVFTVNKCSGSITWFPSYNPILQIEKLKIFLSELAKKYFKC